MIKRSIRGGYTSPKLASQLIVYTLATTFSISPMEVYKMPASMVMDMLSIHKEVKLYEAEETEKIHKKYKV
tara:strand:- start:374 stop:586 length:213 start_codon:yes stop_codon:yes gene_type:complete